MRWTKKVKERFWAKVDKIENGCWIWKAGKSSKGYGRFSIDGKPEFAHRVSWSMLFGPVPIGFGICHKCDSPPCVNPEHLFAGTQAENMIDRDKKGRTSRTFWPKNGKAKLSDQQVEEIRSFPKDVSSSDIAKIFGAGVSTIGHIRRGTRRIRSTP